MNDSEIRDFLEEYYLQYNKPSYIESDPISIPHNFEQKEDIEITGFWAATLAWGNRKAIIKSAKQLLTIIGNSPTDFIKNGQESDFANLNKFVYRTFNSQDAIYFAKSLQNIYNNHGGLENVFVEAYRQNHSIAEALAHFREIFFEIGENIHTQKHIGNINKESACKRLNMFLRWMVRNDNRGVDFGIWRQISATDLYIPLDIHSGRISRQLGLLNRKQNDWKAVAELTNKLRQFDSNDPVKYDFALFGFGVFEGANI